MTTVTIISICLAVVLAFFLGRCMYISKRRANRVAKQKDEIKKLKDRKSVV